jgi:hypothetical protein
MAAVTQINADYLKKLQGNLQDLLGQVNDQLEGLGTKGATGATTGYIPPVTSSLTVAAGASTFDAGAAINKALQSMGGSVSAQLTWLKNVLTDMISEITTTVNSFSGTESLNNESVTQLMTDFQKTINDINSPASSGTSTPGSGTTTPPSTTPPATTPPATTPGSGAKTPATTGS